MRLSSLSLCVLVGCATEMAPSRAPCLDDASCLDGEVCLDGACLADGAALEEAPPLVEGDEPIVEESEPPPEDDPCPEHASLMEGSTTLCHCDDGYLADVATGTCVVDTAPPGNAPPVDAPPEEPPPEEPPPEEPPPEEPPPEEQQDECGPNAVRVSFLCICLPGMIVNPSGPGCIPEPTCPAHAELHADGSCYCEFGYVVDDTGAACEADGCLLLGYYGDGQYCDSFCAWPDSDC